MENSKKFIIQTIIMLMSLLILLGSIIVYIDPYFHFHGPLDRFEYPLYNERYQNDGISRYWDYDAIITGSSMTECFKTSEFNKLFNANSIKIPCSGGKYKEIDEQLKRALKRNSSIKYIVRSLDFDYMILDKNEENKEELPKYLYDENAFNDVSYVFNKEILVEDVVKVIDFTNAGKETTSFDEYMNWSSEREMGREVILEHYKRPKRVENVNAIDNKTKQIVRENIEQNVLQTISENPNVQFYLFFPPYGIYWWDKTDRRGNVERYLEIEKYVIEMLLEYDNIQLYSFFDNFELICNSDVYVDEGHYNESINSQMLLWMKNGEYKLTEDNYLQYCDKVKDFYLNYDYESLYD